MSNFLDLLFMSTRHSRPLFCVKVLFINDLVRNIKQLKEDIKALALECHEFMKLGDLTLVEERSFFLAELEVKLNKCFGDQELYNSRELVITFPNAIIVQNNFCRMIFLSRNNATNGCQLA